MAKIFLNVRGVSYIWGNIHNRMIPMEGFEFSLVEVWKKNTVNSFACTSRVFTVTLLVGDWGREGLWLLLGKSWLRKCWLFIILSHVSWEDQLSCLCTKYEATVGWPYIQAPEMGSRTVLYVHVQEHVQGWACITRDFIRIGHNCFSVFCIFVASLLLPPGTL